jgi:hypothetical protein
MIKRYLIVIGTFILLTFSSCLKDILCISGNGIEQTESSSLRISGSGDISAENLILSSAYIIISGSGDAYTNVDKSLNAVISGSGNIYLKGDPEISKTISGSGKIIKYK